mgnify:FL=1
MDQITIHLGGHLSLFWQEKQHNPILMSAHWKQETNVSVYTGTRMPPCSPKIGSGSEITSSMIRNRASPKVRHIW